MFGQRVKQFKSKTLMETGIQYEPNLEAKKRERYGVSLEKRMEIRVELLLPS